MSSSADASPRDRRPLAHILILILAGAFVGLMVDIRIEHVDAVRDHAIAWVPIVYSGFMTIACAVAFAFWNKPMRLTMRVLFAVAFVVGGIGFYRHNHGHPTKVLRTSVNAWTDPNMSHSDGPPPLAPLAFAGLGLIGILASLKRFNS